LFKYSTQYFTCCIRCLIYSYTRKCRECLLFIYSTQYSTCCIRHDTHSNGPTTTPSTKHSVGLVLYTTSEIYFVPSWHLTQKLCTGTTFITKLRYRWQQLSQHTISLVLLVLDLKLSISYIIITSLQVK